MNKRTTLGLIGGFVFVVISLVSAKDYFRDLDPAVAQKLGAILANWRSITPEILQQPENQAAIPILKQMALETNDPASIRLMLNLGDPDVIERLLRGFHGPDPSAAWGLLQDCSQPKLIPLLADDLNRNEGTKITYTWIGVDERHGVAPLSVYAGDIMRGIIQNSSKFSAEVKAWVAGLEPERHMRREETRQAMRVWWAQNKDLLVAGKYDLVKPPGNNQLTALGPAQVWIGLKNSDDVGTKFDFLAEVLKNGTVIGSGQVNDVAGGSSGFNNAKLDAINLATPGAVPINPGDTLSLRLSVRIATTGHRSGTARLWYNDAAANSRFSATIAGAATSYFLRSGSTLTTTAGTGPKSTIDVFVDRAVGGNAFKPFGTWNKSF